MWGAVQSTPAPRRLPPDMWEEVSVVGRCGQREAIRTALCPLSLPPFFTPRSWPGATRTPSRRGGSAAGGAEAEAAEDEECLLAERAARGQHSELDGGVVQVEEAADPQEVVVLELAVEDAVNDDEAIRRREAFELGTMGAEQLAGRGHAGAVGESLAGLLQARVGGAGPEPRGVAGERVDSLEWLVRERVLVVDRARAQRAERVRVLARPRGLPSVEQLVDRHPPIRSSAVPNAGTPCSGVEASAYRRRGILP